MQCGSPLGIRVVMTTVSVSVVFLPLLCPLFFLTKFSVNSFQILLSLAMFLYSCHTLPKSFSMHSSRRNHCLPRLVFSCTFWISALFLVFLSQSNLYSQLVHSSLICSHNSHDRYYPVAFRKPALSPVVAV